MLLKTFYEIQSLYVGQILLSTFYSVLCENPEMSKTTIFCWRGLLFSMGEEETDKYKSSETWASQGV